MKDKEWQKLKSTLSELQGLQIEVRRWRRDLDYYELELNIQYGAEQISDFIYAVKYQQINRSREMIHEALRKLQDQRTQILSMLRNR